MIVIKREKNWEEENGMAEENVWGKRSQTHFCKAA